MTWLELNDLSETTSSSPLKRCSGETNTKREKSCYTWYEPEILSIPPHGTRTLAGNWRGTEEIGSTGKGNHRLLPYPRRLLKPLSRPIRWYKEDLDPSYVGQTGPSILVGS
jgi:hypothetical protein